MSDLVFSCKKLSKTFTDVGQSLKVLDKVDLELRQGEMLMLVGPSGSGKTTLLSILSGLLDFEEGECQVLGQNLYAMSQDEQAEFRANNIGYVFQNFNLIPLLNAYDNISIPLLLQGKDPLKTKTLLNKLELSPKSLHYPWQLSGGQKQRIAIARAIIHEPKLILCDEPTSALDHHTGIKVMNILRKIVEHEGRSIVLVTHDNRILEYADRIVHLEDGKLRKD